jgi:23S rRNA G2069 N7-methylase RlmK/C1962 C5-methylase RlmI
MRYLASQDGFELIIDVKDDYINVGIYNDRTWIDSLASVSRSKHYDRASDSIIWESSCVSQSSINTSDERALEKQQAALEYAIKLKYILDYSDNINTWLETLEKEEG